MAVSIDFRVQLIYVKKDNHEVHRGYSSSFSVCFKNVLGKK